MTLSIRPAEPDDAEFTSSLIYLSMGELADYLFGGVRLSVEEILSGLFLLEKNRFSREVMEIADWNGKPVGMLASYPGWEFSDRELAIGLGLLKVCGFWDTMRLSFRALSISSGVETLRNEFYLAHMAVSPDYQGRGIGTGLLAHAEIKAQQIGLYKCSLIVDTENPAARRLYQRSGYQVVFTKFYSGKAASAHAGYHRMVKDLF